MVASPSSPGPLLQESCWPERKGVDVSLFGVAASIGVVQSELEKPLAGQASLGIAKKLGVRGMALQRFIGGEVSMSKAYAHRMLQSKLRHCGTAWSGKGTPLTQRLRTGAGMPLRRSGSRPNQPGSVSRTRRGAGRSSAEERGF